MRDDNHTTTKASLRSKAKYMKYRINITHSISNESVSWNVTIVQKHLPVFPATWRHLAHFHINAFPADDSLCLWAKMNIV